MDGADDIRSEAAELRRLSAELAERADALERLAGEVEADLEAAAAAGPSDEPLQPATSEEETAARLIALDGASSGRARSEVEAELSSRFPAVDAAGLLDRFYR